MQSNICGAKTRSGKPCQSKPVTGRKRCRMHGGTQPRGPESVHFIHGLRSNAFKGELKQHFDLVSKLDDPLDLFHELAAQRTLFDSYINQFEDGQTIKEDDINALMRWSDAIGRTVERIIKARNESALTVAQIQFIKAGIVALLSEFIPNADRRVAFVSRLNQVIPERSTIDSEISDQ